MRVGIVVTDWCFDIAFAHIITNYENSLGLSVFVAVQMKRVLVEEPLEI